LVEHVDFDDREAWLREIDRRLQRRYRNRRHYNLRNPLSELVFVVLSSRTPEARYLEVYRSFRKQFRSWSAVANAPISEVEAALRRGGLSRRKAESIQAILHRIRLDFGRMSLDHLKEMSTEEAEAYLCSLPGVNVKTARCVLMYSLGRDVFPVDTHVWRIFKRLGIGEGGRVPTRRQADELQDAVPEDIRYTLHVNLVSLGRDVCRSRVITCEMCPIDDLCPMIEAAFY